MIFLAYAVSVLIAFIVFGLIGKHFLNADYSKPSPEDEFFRDSDNPSDRESLTIAAIIWPVVLGFALVALVVVTISAIFDAILFIIE